ncbi:MAG: hypothetical protein LBB07_00555, partial [Bifidobacteriaceae bacterium]|nr:hypothetical protein [Bifidobacteriaceae bacterium]
MAILEKMKSKYFLYPFFSFILSLLIVILWYPSNLWQYPIQFTDAPAHYYYIEKLVRNGFGSAMHLTLEGGFYPPLYHIVAAIFIKIFHVGVMTGSTLSWLFFNAIVFPVGMIFLVSYFIGRKNIFILALTPILSVSFFAFPYLLLHQGPLLAYAAATALLPFLIYFTLKFFDALIDFLQNKNKRLLIIYFSASCILGLLSVLAQPRILFAYGVFILPFLIDYLRKIYKINPKIA